MTCSTAAGRLRPGEFSLPGDVSSQYISGLLMALPLLNEGSALTVTGGLESAAYVTMTEDALRRGGVSLRKTGGTWHISGGQRLRFPDRLTAEGDWSNAAFFLCMGALVPGGRHCSRTGSGLLSGGPGRFEHSAPPWVRVVSTENGSVTVRRGELKGVAIDARPHPRPDPGAVRHSLPGRRGTPGSSTRDGSG